MNKFIYFMAVGLAFTALQVATVEAAEDCMSHPAGPARAACEAGGGDGGPDCEAMGAPGSAARTMCEAGQKAAHNDGHHPPPCPAGTTCEGMDHHGGTTTDTDTCAAMQGTARDDCYGAKSEHHDGPPPGTTAMCPGPLNTMIPCTTAGATGEGMDHHVMMDPRTNPPVPFSPADEAIYQPYADECESNGGKISEASMGILITPPHNFTRLQVERLCQESVHDDGADASCMPLADGTLPPHCK